MNLQRSTSQNDNKTTVFLFSELAEIKHFELSNAQINYVENNLDLDELHIIQNEKHLFFVRLKGGELPLDIEKTRKKSANILKLLNQKKIDAICLEASPTITKQHSLAFVEAMGLANYQFLKYFTEDKTENSMQTIETNLFSKDDKTNIEAIWSASSFAKDLVNEPVSFLTATELSNQTKKHLSPLGVEVEILEKKQIETLKMGGLLAVNKGSFDPPTFTIATWKPKNALNEKPIVLVGKGIVYDTGGLSLKPTQNSMDFMKSDMGGAACMLGGLYAVAKAKLPYYVIAVVPATDNRPGNKAYAPGDVITMFNGKTVEVLNTDAEGRMVLADALSYVDKYNPQLVIDAATLTGAAVATLGDQGVALMGTASETDKAQLTKSGMACYERVVELPFFEEYGEYIKSDIADIKNIGGPTAGTITAGKFLEHFVSYPWLHLDIAPMAWSKKETGYIQKGATAVGVRLLFDFIQSKAK